MARARTKGKDDTPEVVCLVENGRLVPAYPHDAEVLASYSKGAKVYATLRREGKRRQHSIWYGLIGDMVKTGQTKWASAKAADRACRIALDMIEPAKGINGDWVSYDASLWDFSDEELDERIELLRALFRKITGLDPDDVRRELGGGNFDDGYTQPANDAGDETLAGDAVPQIANEEGASADPVPTPVGTGATEIQEKNTSPEDEIPPDSGGLQGERSEEAAAPSDEPEPAEAADPEAGSIEAQAEPDAPPASELTSDELAWLKQGGKMMLACLPSTDPESLRVLVAQVRIIISIAPKDVSDACLNRMEVIRLHVKGVCDGQIPKVDIGLVAKTALTTIGEITPDPVRSGKT